MTKEFKVGDPVTDVILGKTGKVIRSSKKHTFDVGVEFDDEILIYTSDGKFSPCDAIPRLYYGEVTIEIKQPVYEYQVIYKTSDGEIYMTFPSDNFCSSKDEFVSYYSHTYEFIELYQPSKRARK